MNKSNNIESWVVELFKDIEKAAEMNEDFTLRLDKDEVQNLAFETRSLEWIEIY